MTKSRSPWKSFGRFVKKGEHGIRIFAPIFRKVEEEKNGATEQSVRGAISDDRPYRDQMVPFPEWGPSR